MFFDKIKNQKIKSDEGKKIFSVGVKNRTEFFFFESTPTTGTYNTRRVREREIFYHIFASG